MAVIYGYSLNVYLSSGISIEISSGKKVGLGGYAKDYEKVGFNRSQGVERLKQKLPYIF
jgi:hypothetical protein